MFIVKYRAKKKQLNPANRVDRINRRFLVSGTSTN